MTAPPQRRWFRFSLRTLLLAVTIVAVWLGWNLRTVRERRAILAELAQSSNPLTYFVTIADAQADTAHPPRPASYDRHLQIPWSRKLLGDQAYSQISVRNDVDRKLLERAEYAFPEAMIVVFSNDEGPLIDSFRDSLYAPADKREPNLGNYFKTGLIKK